MTTKDSHSRLLLPVLFIGAFMYILDVFIVYVATPSLRSELGASASDVQWVVGGYVLTFAVALITGGRLGDIFGRRRVFRAGLVGFTVASALCAAAPSPGALIAARVLQGLGAALMWPQVLSIIQVEFAPQERARPLAMLGVVAGLGAMSGQIIGGALIGIDALGLGWRWVFLVNLPLGLAALLLTRRAIPESRSSEAPRLDLRGVALGSLLLAMIAVPIIQGRELGWPPWAFATLAAALPVGWLFVSLERSVAAGGHSPLVELRLFRARDFSYGVVAMGLLYAVISFFFLVTLYLQDGAGLTPIESGLVFTPLASAFASASILGPRLMARVGDALAAAGALVAATGIAATAAVMTALGDTFNAAALIPVLVLVGAGMGLFIPPMLRIVLRSVPPADAGAASGILTTAQQLGNGFAIALVGTVFFGVLGDGGGLSAYAEAFTAAAAIQVTAAVAGAGLVVRMIGRPARAAAEPEAATS
jgi:EmrB/QacA subfamily drug resistance transporter